MLASVFPGLSHGLDTRLAETVAAGNEADLSFVLGVLSAFEGKPCVYELVRSIVATSTAESPLLEAARAVLRESGVVMGEYGFAELHVERKRLLETWLADPCETVRSFAVDHIHELDMRIPAETRSAEASIAMRKLNYGEALAGGAAKAE